MVVSIRGSTRIAPRVCKVVLEQPVVVLWGLRGAFRDPSSSSLRLICADMRFSELFFACTLGVCSFGFFC